MDTYMKLTKLKGSQNIYKLFHIFVYKYRVDCMETLMTWGDGRLNREDQLSSHTLDGVKECVSLRFCAHFFARPSFLLITDFMPVLCVRSL